MKRCPAMAACRQHSHNRGETVVAAGRGGLALGIGHGILLAASRRHAADLAEPIEEQDRHSWTLPVSSPARPNLWEPPIPPSEAIVSAPKMNDHRRLQDSKSAATKRSPRSASSRATPPADEISMPTHSNCRAGPATQAGCRSRSAADCDGRSRCLFGRGRVQRGRFGCWHSSCHNNSAVRGAESAFDLPTTLRRLASSMPTSASGRARGPSQAAVGARPFRSASDIGKAWCSSAGAAAAPPSSRGKPTARAIAEARAGQGNDQAPVAGSRRTVRSGSRWATPKKPGRRRQVIGLLWWSRPQDGNQGKGVAVNVAPVTSDGRLYRRQRKSAAISRRTLFAGHDSAAGWSAIAWWPLPAAIHRKYFGDGVLAASVGRSRVNSDPRAGDGHPPP